MPDAQIVGISLVQNEDLFLHNVIDNVESFCDTLIIADHKSKDGTAEVSKAICARHKHVRYEYIKHPRQSHEIINDYAGTNTWIFAVDGDEIYDPVRLENFRNHLIRGDFDDCWMILGNVLNCVSFNGKTASGYLAPPCRSMVKLYNFNLIDAWEGPCPERLHGGNIVYRVPKSHRKRYEYYKEIEWDDSLLRCLHMCFFRRSSIDRLNFGDKQIRMNISDKNQAGITGKILFFMKKSFGKRMPSGWKHQKYMRGQKVVVDCKNFGVKTIDNASAD